MGDGSLIILDTHVWAWHHLEPRRISKPARRVIAAAGRVGIPAICSLEFATMVEDQRVRLTIPVVEWLEAALAMPNTELLPVTPAIAALAARIGTAHLPDPADRLIAATAQEHRATLVTKDHRLLTFSPITTAW